MKVSQSIWSESSGWQQSSSESTQAEKVGLVLGFGSKNVLSQPQTSQELCELYPHAQVVTLSTSGEIHPNGEIWDDSLAATCLEFDHTEIQAHSLSIHDYSCSQEAGRALGQLLKREDLAHVLVFSDGQLINGTALSEGLNAVFDHKIPVTGGLAGDGDRFESTLVGLNGEVCEGKIVGIGLYGERIRVGYGCRGGWDPFGPIRTVTKSQSNVLFELDGKNALDLYKHYLGDQAEGLPGTGLLFPLALIDEEKGSLVRTILAVSEEDKSMTFAGEVPEGTKVQLMRANFDRLIDGASSAACDIQDSIGSTPVDFALLISCVGRRLVLGPRTEEEIEGVSEMLGNPKIGGFYSYGELCPMVSSRDCSLHNQTMTITTLREE